MEIKNLQLKVDDWIKSHGVRYFNELTNMAQLTEEVGEVVYMLKTILIILLFVLLCLANQTGVDLQKSFDDRLKMKAERDHDRHHTNEKLS